MKNLFDNLSQIRLFSGMTPKEAGHLLTCLHAKTIAYQEDTTVISEGFCVRDFGVLLTGSGRSYKTDTEGRTITITLLYPGSEIGVILAASSHHQSPVSVEVQKGSCILFISYDRMTASCSKSCLCHKRLLTNFMSIIAEKGLVLHERLDCLLRSPARDKIITFLKRFSDTKRGTFTIPLDRNAMAEYLNMDRSALSRELGRMKEDGIIDFYKSTFRLLP